jgi:hypothetical protein
MGYSYRVDVNATDWKGPPSDILGCAVPIQQFVARTDSAVVALPHAIAFREGCILNLDVAVQRGSLDKSAWDGSASDRGYPLFTRVNGQLMARRTRGSPVPTRPRNRQLDHVSADSSGDPLLLPSRASDSGGSGR